MTEQSDHELACLCLDVVGKYVSWIDINLVANDKVVGYSDMFGVCVHVGRGECWLSLCQVVVTILDYGESEGKCNRLSS